MNENERVSDVYLEMVLQEIDTFQKEQGTVDINREALRMLVIELQERRAQRCDPMDWRLP